MDIQTAIISLYPDAQFAGPKGTGGYADIRWHKKPAGITEAKVLTKLTELKSAYDAQAYARSRKKEYPTVEECIHAILDNDLETLKVKRQAVKAKYPKPG
tara:strand:+ start:277 stop:576 length:300 start_codon:yes stop_codon:yes gene_type:complete